MHVLSSAVGRAALAGSAACCLVAGAAAPVDAGTGSSGLAVAGSADHRHPVPGETEVLRWTVRNTGSRAWTRVRLRVTVPARWRAQRIAGCRAAGRRVSCELGGLAARAHRRMVIRLVVPVRPPRYGSVRIRATTAAWSGRDAFAGPAAAFSVTVVRAR